MKKPARARKLRVAFDANSWISCAIGKKLAGLEQLTLHPRLRVFCCEELIEEFRDVSKRPAVAKYIPSNRAGVVESLLHQLPQTKLKRLRRGVVRDPKDEYLIALSFQENLDYLVTNDQDLLSLGRYHGTVFIRYADFLRLLDGDL